MMSWLNNKKSKKVKITFEDPHMQLVYNILKRAEEELAKMQVAWVGLHDDDSKSGILKKADEFILSLKSPIIHLPKNHLFWKKSLLEFLEKAEKKRDIDGKLKSIEDAREYMESIYNVSLKKKAA